MNLEGVIVPLITPLQADESLDEEGLERLVEHVISGGVAGIFVLGSSGEGPLLPYPVKERLVRVVYRRVRGRVPVLVGVFGLGITGTIEEAGRLTRVGGDAIVLTAPFYFTHTQEEIANYLEAVACSQSVPTVIYNIPQMVKVIVEPSTLERLSENPKIIGVKDSHGDMVRFQETLRLQRDGFAVFQGAEGLAALSVARGARGAVLGLANVAPRLCCDLVNAARAGDLPRAWALQERLMTLWRLHTHGPWLPCLKAAVSLLGICGPRAGSPFQPLSEEQMAAIRRDLEAAEVLPQVEGEMSGRP
jgi:4-hydroxy-tetrahydrodipicolinate synthase